MTSDEALQELRVVKEHLGFLLDDAGKRALAAATKSMETQHAALDAIATRAKKKKGLPAPDPWSLKISPGLPLSFLPTNKGLIVKHRLLVDLFCDISEPADGAPRGGTHNVAVRVWSDDPAVCFDAERDAEALKTAVRRVMLRFHFDYANPGQDGPTHHLQVGGKQHSGELFWLPDNWKLPRFVHHPLSLLMACEFILRTFFGHHYAAISKEVTWREALAVAQRAYLAPYLRRLPFVTMGANPDFKRSCLAELWAPTGT